MRLERTPSGQMMDVKGTLERVDELIRLDLDLYNPETSYEKQLVTHVKTFVTFVHKELRMRAHRKYVHVRQVCNFSIWARFRCCQGENTGRS